VADSGDARSNLPHAAAGAVLTGLLLVTFVVPLREPEVRAVIWSPSTGAWTATAPLREQGGPDLHQLDDGTVVVGDPRDGQAYELSADRWRPTSVFSANPFPPWNPTNEPLPAALARETVFGGRWPDGALLAVAKRAAFFKGSAAAEWTALPAGPTCDIWTVATAAADRALLLCRGIPSKVFALDVSAGTWSQVVAPREIRFDFSTYVARLTDGRVLVLAAANTRRLLPLSLAVHALGYLGGAGMIVLVARAARSPARRRVRAIVLGALFPTIVFVGWILMTFVIGGIAPR
jgi:hypothetical protein